MALTKIEFRPGINKEATNYANEGGYFACDHVRFRSGTPEKIGGWINQSVGNTFYGVNNTLFNWSSYTSQNLMTVGTNQLYYIEYSGLYHDITPVRATVTLGAAPFATTNGSRLVVVTAAGHGASAATFISISGATAVAGLTLNGIFEIISVPDGNTYTILGSANANASTTGGGAAVVVVYKLNAGNTTTTTTGGWGSGSWSGGTWSNGSGGLVNVPIQGWSQCLTGQDLVLNPSSGELYYWTLDTTTWNVATLLSTKADSVVATTKAATFGGVTSTITVPDSFNVVAGSVISGTNIVAGTYVTTAYTGGLSVPISVATTGASGGTYTFSYSGSNVPNNSLFVMNSDVSGFIIALGANPYDPTTFTSTFLPMLVRWSDQNNPYEWTPQNSNQSGEQILSAGSFLVCGLNTRQENLIFSNSALYSMQYLGPPYVWGFNMIMDNLSIMSAGAAIVINNVAYWMGKDKFYMYDGGVKTLDCSLRHFVFNDINLTEAHQVVTGSNEGYNEIWWHYPSSGSQVNDSYVIFNYQENIWYYGTMNRSSWEDSPLRAYPMASFSVQTTYLNPTVAVTTAASGNGTTATISFATLSSVPDVGSSVIVAGVTPAGFNGLYTLTAATLTSVSYLNATAGPQTVAGTVTLPLSSTATTISVLNGTSYPASGVLQIDSEKITYTDITNNNFTGCTRGTDGTTAALHTPYSTAAYTIPNQIMYHEYGIDDQSSGSIVALPSYLQASDFDIGDGDHLAYVWRIVPDLTFDGSTAANPQVMLTLTPRLNPGSAYTTGVDTPTVTRTATVPVEQFTGQVYTRVRGRQMSFRIDSSAVGVTWQGGAMRFDLRPDGRR